MNTMLVFILVFLLICCIAATAAGLPGNYAMMLVLVGFGLLDGFRLFSVTAVALLVGALVLGEVIEFLAGMIGVRRKRRGWKTQMIAVGGGILGGIIGSGILPIVGSLIGVVIGVFLATYAAVYYEHQDQQAAKSVAISAAIAQLIGTGLKVVISLFVLTTVVFLAIVAQTGATIY